MHVVSSTTTMPPEPIMEPAATRLSKSTGDSRRSAGRQPPEGPPSCTALNSRPGSMPPPMSKMTSRSEAPIGTSTRPPFLSLPVRLKILVPFEVSVPMAAKASAPLSTIQGTLAKVSTLFRLVGCCQSPWATVRMCLPRGMPRWPSMLAVRAVDSPHTKAPAPWLTMMSKSNPEPRMSWPSRPRCRACTSAASRRWTANGYSART